ncbi:MAG: YggS family pyridoxal phosphate-dependent enzyme [Lachnospiraceae bacterium]|nr:YggS family pyridoxal phosphate-dependent enzyme [Lachnospiraceae bacterium]
MLKENAAQVEKRVAAACEKAGRSRGEVCLIAVSKTKPVSDIEEVLETGILDFGENKPQEMKEKHDVLPDNIRWHMIGHLQTNKVKYVVGRAVMIHSVDSLKLAQAIEKEAEKKGLDVDVLLEVNVGGEESKSGVRPEDAASLAEAVSVLPRLHIRGLMTVPPVCEDPEEARPYFRKLRQLSVDIGAKNIDNVSMNVLSMGMTADFETAIEEGATHVRVGTAIFGERDYNKQL